MNLLINRKKKVSEKIANCNGTGFFASWGVCLSSGGDALFQFHFKFQTAFLASQVSIGLDKVAFRTFHTGSPQVYLGVLAMISCRKCARKPKNQPYQVTFR